MQVLPVWFQFFLFSFFCFIIWKCETSLQVRMLLFPLIFHLLHRVEMRSVVRESVLFIGTQFSNLYTAVDTPARGRVILPVCMLPDTPWIFFATRWINVLFRLHFIFVSKKNIYAWLELLGVISCPHGLVSFSLVLLNLLLTHVHVMHAYTNVCTHAYKRIHTCIRMYIHALEHTYMHAYLCTYMHLNIHSFVHTF